MRGRSFALAILALASALLAACGSSGNEQTPAACLSGPATYLDALAAAPGQVRLQASTPISDCVVSGQEGGELATAGRSIVTAATRLNASARQDPGSAATVQLGYLVGAVQEGAGGTGGIHADLVRRLDQAARFSPEGQPSAEFERAFGTGYAAGQADG
ncbi:MAG: hypothetical protein ACXWD7_07505 [Solirubrobacterales bacterium]